MPEKQKTDQFIAIYFSYIEAIDIALSYALPLAKILSKGIVFLYVQDSKYTFNRTSDKTIEEKISQVQQLLLSEGICTKYYSLKGKTSEVLKENIEKLNIVCLISAIIYSVKGNIHAPKELLKNLESIKSAYLLVQEPLRDESLLKNVAFTIDFEKESKEKIPWAGYFGRFNQSQVHVFHADYKDEFLSKSTSNNRRLVEKIFSELNVNFSMQNLGKIKKSPDMEALTCFEQKKIGLLVAVSTKGKAFIDILKFRPEYKTIQNPNKIPVLMLNPREDIYVLCD